MPWTVGRTNLGGGKRSTTAKQGGEVGKGPRGIRAKLRRETDRVQLSEEKPREGVVVEVRFYYCY